jgi:molybdopterin synthase sulfur carrier subunit
MKITLHTMLAIKQALGQRQTEIELPQGSTLEGLFVCMKEKWGAKLTPHLFDPDSGAVHSHLRIMVNGQTIQFLNGMETPLKDGDDVAILPLISGG